MKRGFKSLSEEKLKEIGGKGGRVKNPNKGFGSMPKDKLSKLSSEAANKRWREYREQKATEAES